MQAYTLRSNSPVSLTYSERSSANRDVPLSKVSKPQIYSLLDGVSEASVFYPHLHI